LEDKEVRKQLASSMAAKFRQLPDESEDIEREREFHLFLCRKSIANYKQIIYVTHQVFYSGFLVRGS